MKPEIQQVVEAIRNTAGKGLNLGALARRWQLDPPEVKRLHSLVRQLVEAGGVRLQRGNKVVWEHPSVVDGVIHLRSDGKGTLRDPDHPAERLGSLNPRRLGEAIQGDYVLAHLRRRGPRWEAKVLAVLERRVTRLTGVLEAGGRSIPEDARMPVVTLSNPEATEGCEGQLAAVTLETDLSDGEGVRGSLVEVFGAPDSQEAEIRSLVYKYDLPHGFPAEVLAEADAIPAETALSPERRDLRDLPFVTIDGETAMDFDDAVCLRVEGDKKRLWVGIADVSHYVRPGSPLDQEARERGTSVYFPGYCIPMLPERLSNDLCSLRPEEERLVLCAELLFSADGRVKTTDFYPGLLRSRARLTYTEVARQLEQGLPEGAPPQLAQLVPMASLAQQLYRARLDRGGLDFDLPEPEILLDLQGRPEDLVHAPRTEAHRLIEECMLAANEAVAEYLTRRGHAFLSRVHDPPPADKLVEFQQAIAYFNQGINLAHPDGLHGAFAEFLRRAEDQPGETALNRLLLRTMSQAVYSPEANGHFGLALEHYCHFTSPIRRYPDLLVHRALKTALRRKPQAQLPLEEEGAQASTRERRAMDAEREIVQLKKCQFMEGRIGATFEGTICGVAGFGFFVELAELPVEGLVPMASLVDDYYQFDGDAHCLVGERRRRQFQLGGKVAIIVSGVDLVRREITFQVEGMEAPRSSAEPRRQRRGGYRRKRR